MDIEAFKDKYEHKKVIENTNSVAKNPLVSVCIQTYQHEDYIKECLDSIITQKTDFQFEVLLGEDASDDSTRAICISYAKRYPNKIRLFLHHRENNISISDRPSGRFNFVYNLHNAKGKYIALCEGDDYWTDPLKLQKQIDFLEDNKDCSLVFTSCEIKKDNGERRLVKFDGLTKIDANEYVKNSFFMATASLVFKTDILKLFNKEWMFNSFAFDFVIIYSSLINNKIGYINECMVVYNKGTEGSWSKRKFDKKMILKEYSDVLRAVYMLDKHGLLDISVRNKKIKKMRQAVYYKMSASMGKFEGMLYLISNIRNFSLFYVLVFIKQLLKKKT
jgi:glycosyltransferase involved in cell wall biosynthesis